MPAFAMENAPTINAKATAKSSKVKGIIVPKAMNNVGSEAHLVLVAKIESAERLTDLPRSFSTSKQIKDFRATCYYAWMVSDDPFDGFSLESDNLLSIIRTAFTETFPDVEYVPKYKDIFHQTVSATAIFMY